MLGVVHRQRELRRLILLAAYAALLQDPDGFMDTDTLDFSHMNDPEGPAGEAGPEGEAATNEPPPSLVAQDAPTPIEVRAAAYYLIERGLLFPMPVEAMRRESIPPDELRVHVTADGVDAIEALILDGSRVPARPIGFNVGVSSVHDARPTKATPSSPPARLAHGVGSAPADNGGLRPAPVENGGLRGQGPA